MKREGALRDPGRKLTVSHEQERERTSLQSETCIIAPNSPSAISITSASVDL